MARLGGHGEGDLQAAFSPDGSRLAAASATGQVAVWNTSDWPCAYRRHASGGGQLAVAFSPGGARLATGGADDQVHLWDAAEGAHLLAVPVAASPYDLAWTPDGRRLLVVPLDGTLRVLE